MWTQCLLGGMGLVYRTGPHSAVRMGGFWVWGAAGGAGSQPSLPQVGGARPAQRVTINSQLLGPWPVKWNFVLRQLRFYGVLPGACDLPVYK